jgi:hypothetical protein
MPWLAELVDGPLAGETFQIDHDHADTPPPSHNGVDVVRLEDAQSEPSFLADLIADGRVLVDREELWPRLRSREPSLRRAGRLRQAQRTEAVLAGIDRMLAR